MIRIKTRLLLRWIAAYERRWRHPVLARSLARLSDSEIDGVLQCAGLTRKDLFSVREPIAEHRGRMAHMLSALEIDVERAVSEHWTALKHADDSCSRCAQVGRCRRWRDGKSFNDAPENFCPNASLFAFIGTQQAKDLRQRL